MDVVDGDDEGLASFRESKMAFSRARHECGALFIGKFDNHHLRALLMESGQERLGGSCNGQCNMP
jgi:hypothetical protein